MVHSGTVHVIDDDEATRDSLVFLLASAGVPVAAHESATAFLQALPALEVGCVVTDVRMPDLNGIDLMKSLQARRPDLPVIVITGHGDIALAVDAMKQGAIDFLEKPYDDTAILAAVTEALGKRATEDRVDRERVAIGERFGQLSPREQQVLRGIVAGKANKVIAHDLDISPRTVEVYRANLMTKMQASSLSHLVRMVFLARLDTPSG